ncbi:peroxidase [Favolaschia claudopus]|uniref:Peroxidase n=1 Tax=Favolaschia claudopus TaxID=2862362 RepID=A0AAW0CGF0_9AGAR
MLTLASTLLATAAGATAYIWPSPQLDALEAARFDVFGINSASAFSGFIQPCDQFFSSFTGRSNAADWIRTAYHDMATFNSDDGTGGLDASIRFAEEQARPENVGDGFANTMQIITGQSNRYISIADSIALAALIAIENCGGPEIPFRGNRVDAIVPNSPGVPEPQQDIDAHIESFRKQGFTKEEMIGLVACGHSFGGVQHDAFPDTVPDLNDPDNTQSVQHFDTTFVTFDNNVATEYISGTTQNPLVSGHNDTTNSDKRIFMSDGNVTMRAFADSPSVFASTCSTLFARMLDTVPKETKLTEVITPMPVKPRNVLLTLDNSTLRLFGKVRLWNTAPSTSRSVRLLYTTHLGTTGNVTLGDAGISSSTGNKYTSSWYSFNASFPFSFLGIDAVAGVTSLSFLIDGKLENQGGLGYAVQDGVLFSSTSCTIPGGKTVRFDVAVRKTASPIRVFLENIDTDALDMPLITEIDVPRPANPISINDAYEIWSLDLPAAGNSYGIGAEFPGGVKYSSEDLHHPSGGEFVFNTCSS